MDVDVSTMAAVCAAIKARGGAWVLKESNTNNALNVVVFDAAEAETALQFVQSPSTSTAGAAGGSASSAASEGAAAGSTGATTGAGGGAGAVAATVLVPSAAAGSNPATTSTATGTTTTTTSTATASTTATAAPTHYVSKRRSDPLSWTVQHYLMNPLLCRGCKFHIRVNVLAVGFLKVHSSHTEHPLTWF